MVSMPPIALGVKEAFLLPLKISIFSILILELEPEVMSVESGDKGSWISLILGPVVSQARERN